MVLSMSLSAQSVSYYKTYYDEFYKTRIKTEIGITQDGQQHGIQKGYSYDGNLVQIENYKFGEKHGEQKVLYNNGEANTISNYKNGLKNGDFKVFKYDRDKYYLEEKSVYRNDTLLQVSLFTSNGNMIMNTVMNGVCNVWYESGEKRTEYVVVNNMTEGKVTSWHKNAQVSMVGYRVNNEKHGEWMYFDINGNIIKIENWNYDQATNSVRKCGEWKLYYKDNNEEQWELVDLLSEAEYYRIINYDSKENIYKSTEYYITGEKYWNGYFLSGFNASSSSSVKLVKVGGSTYYYKNGVVSSKGNVIYNKGKHSDAKSIKIGSWYYYNNTGELNNVEIWGKDNNYEPVYTSLLKNIDGKTLVNYINTYLAYINNGDSLLEIKRYEKSLINYEKAESILNKNDTLKERIKIAKEQYIIFNKELEKKVEVYNLNEKKVKNTYVSIKYLDNSSKTVVKKKLLYNAYEILRKDLEQKVDLCKELIDCEEYINDLIKLTNKMILLSEVKTKDLEKELKKVDSPETIKQILEI